MKSNLENDRNRGKPKLQKNSVLDKKTNYTMQT